MQWNSQQRCEDPLQRADRNFADLLQEIRILLTSVQILFGFLVALAVNGAADRLGPAQHVLYVVALGAAALASVLLVAPVATHRLLFQRGCKRELVRVAQRAALAGIAGLGVTLCAGFVLVVDLTAGRAVASVLGAALLVTTLGLWVAVPLCLRRSWPWSVTGGVRPRLRRGWCQEHAS